MTDVRSYNQTYWILNADVYFTENPNVGNRIIGTLYTKLEKEINGIENVNITVNGNGEFVFSVSYLVDKVSINNNFIYWQEFVTATLSK